MKIATLTLPFHPNYGAVLQAFALQSILKSLGHEVVSIDLERRSLRKLSRYYLSRIKNIISGGDILDNYEYGNKEFKKFIENELTLTKKIKFERDFYRSDIQNFEAYIVGSDQVWRPKYVMNIDRYFLNFVNKDKVKVSYAASFGTELFDYSVEEKARCIEYIRDFNGISVREIDGVDKCKDEFHSIASLVLDPTLLVDANEYSHLISKYSKEQKRAKAFCYILDAKISKVESIKKAFPQAFFINGESTCKDKDKVCISNWLKGIRDSHIVITDSFHGVAFSIIFNKNFIAIGNKKRGLARFTSLLRLFNLEDRLIIDDELTSELIHKVSKINIDYINVNKILSSEKEKSIDFLINSLSV
ncbi:TPA: polysaccharide pyruvyl transferase family protein [Photobacterium damselae]